MSKAIGMVEYKTVSAGVVAADAMVKAAYVNLVVNRPCTPPTIFGQYCPTASAADEEAQYVKIKSSILGIRYWINEDGVLIINGPNGARQKYSKIKKEAFSWKICQSMVK